MPPCRGYFLDGGWQMVQRSDAGADQRDALVDELAQRVPGRDLDVELAEQVPQRGDRARVRGRCPGGPAGELVADGIGRPVPRDVLGHLAAPGDQSGGERADLVVTLGLGRCGLRCGGRRDVAVELLTLAPDAVDDALACSGD